MKRNNVKTGVGTLGRQSRATGGVVMAPLTLMHGSHRGVLTLHVGLCLTDDEDAASAYACSGAVFKVVIDLFGLRIKEIPGYNHETNEAPGDDGPEALADELDADVVVYEDEDELGQPHKTWRLLTQAALDRIIFVWGGN